MTSPAKPSQARDADSQEVIEEGRHAYRPGGFHPVYIADIYHGRYKILSKIGYGAYSTVWLVRDLEATKGGAAEFRALKVLSAKCYGAEKDVYEREILHHLRDGDQDLMGYKFICHLEDEFEHKGPNGAHACLVFQLCGESLLSFGAWFKDCMIPTEVMRRITIQLLLALDYAHECGVIHTDIKASNILVKMRTYSRIESDYLTQEKVPQDRTEDQYTVIPTRPLSNYYFNDGDRIDELDIVLGDWGVSSWVDKHLCELIQPVALRAPEVLIGAGWGLAADIWNVGAIVLEMYRAVRMFSGRVAPDGHYELREHLAEIEHLIGEFPKALLEKGDPDIVGPMFDEQGRVKQATKFDAEHNLMSEWYTTDLPQDEKEEFVAFLKSAMKIDPAERPTPEDLLRGPWLEALT
ncbi:kinase-like protein [Apiospora sp. TS-2023a]